MFPISVEEAKKRRICRICGQPDIPRQVTPTLVDSFVYNFGKEYAHASCICEPMTEVWAGFPSLVPDSDNPFKFKPPITAENN